MMCGCGSFLTPIGEILDFEHPKRRVIEYGCFERYFGSSYMDKDSSYRRFQGKHGTVRRSYDFSVPKVNEWDEYQ